jgi:hypothetical protein
MVALCSPGFKALATLALMSIPDPCVTRENASPPSFPIVFRKLFLASGAPTYIGRNGRRAAQHLLKVCGALCASSRRGRSIRSHHRAST